MTSHFDERRWRARTPASVPTPPRGNRVPTPPRGNRATLSRGINVATGAARPARLARRPRIVRWPHPPRSAHPLPVSLPAVIATDEVPRPFTIGMHPAAASPLKRAADVLLSAVLLALTAPLLVLLAGLIRLTSPGSPIFVQRRVGYRQQAFRIYKLRTMVDGCAHQQCALARQDGGAMFYTIRNDPRVTRVGRVLRKLSLDELPQLYNVLRGDMSLVGPRPLSPGEVAQFQEPDHFRRFQVKPGLTGLWQVSGRNACPDEERIRLDLAYVDRWSPWLDLEILLRTVPAVITARGVA